MAVTRGAKPNWRETIVDADARRVFEALEDPRWDFRTTEGLAQSTGLPERRVQEVLLEYRPLVRQLPVLDRRARPLYTLAARSGTLQEWLSAFRAFVSKTTSTE